MRTCTQRMIHVHLPCIQRAYLKNAQKRLMFSKIAQVPPGNGTGVRALTAQTDGGDAEMTQLMTVLPLLLALTVLTLAVRKAAAGTGRQATPARARIKP